MSVRSGIRWEERTGPGTPSLDPDLGGWRIQKKRKSHWNATREESGKVYFLKWFFHGPWTLPARKEWRNGKALDRLGIPTVVGAGWGRHAAGSFLVLEGSSGSPADAWRREGTWTAGELNGHCARLAAYAALLHDAGFCHKDFNVYHVLVSDGGLRVIDVGRVARFWRRRWIIKDLASLRASAARERFPESASRSFLRRYLAATRFPWNRHRLIRSVIGKAEQYRRHNEHPGT